MKKNIGWVLVAAGILCVLGTAGNSEYELANKAAEVVLFKTQVLTAFAGAMSIVIGWSLVREGGGR